MSALVPGVTVVRRQADRPAAPLDVLQPSSGRRGRPVPLGTTVFALMRPPP